MSSHRSAEEVKQDQLQAMGLRLGPVFNALYNEVVWLHAKWLEYRKLYAESSRRIELLNSIAGFFFHIVQQVLWENVLLQLARLTDPPKSVGKKNLTLLRLPAVLAEPALASEVQALLDATLPRCSFARDWRNRHLGHRDLALALNSSVSPLPEISRRDVEDVLSGIRAILNRIHVHYLDCEVGFEHFLTDDDAEALVYYLRLAKHMEKTRLERLEQGKLLAEDLQEPPEA